MREYERRFPGVELTSDSGTTASNVERLRNGELDVAFVLTPIESAADLGCVGLVLAERAGTLRYPGVVYRRFVDPSRLPRSVWASASHLPWRPAVSSTSLRN